MRRYTVGLIAVGLLVGAFIGMQSTATPMYVLDDGAAPSPPTPTTSSTQWAPVVSGLIGGLLGLAGSLGAQAIIANKERGQRVDDRAVARIDTMLSGLDALDAAYLKDQQSDLPSAEDQSKLTAAKAQFDRAVGLIADPKVRNAATDWKKLAEAYALTLGEPEENGPTSKSVSDAQEHLTKAVRTLSERLR